MTRSSNPGKPRGEGPRRAGRWDSRPTERGRGERPARTGDARSGGRPVEGVGRRLGQRPATSRPGSGPAARPLARRPATRPADPERLLARQPWQSLRPLIPGDEQEVESRLAALREYARQLLEWNRGVSNLISRHDEPRLVERHLLESLLPARLIASSGAKRLVDFGSGAGLPAVPLALCGIGEHWTLVESRRNKTLFLKKIQQDNKLRDFVVMTGRLEVLVEDGAPALACDAFTSRATAAIGPTLAMAARIVEPGGSAFLWKGSSYEQEMDAARSEWEQAWRLERVTTLADGPNVVATFVRK